MTVLAFGPFLVKFFVIGIVWTVTKGACSLKNVKLPLVSQRYTIVQ